MTSQHEPQDRPPDRSDEQLTWNRTPGAITLVVDDLAATKAFYLAVFGLPVAFEDAESAVFRFGALLVNLLARGAASDLFAPVTPGDAAAGPRFVLTLDVADVDAAAAEVVGRGAELLNGPVDRPWGIRTASFRDPAGHVWEIAGPL